MLLCYWTVLKDEIHLHVIDGFHLRLHGVLAFSTKQSGPNGNHLGGTEQNNALLRIRSVHNMKIACITCYEKNHFFWKEQSI